MKQEATKKSKWWLWLIIGVLVLGLVAGGAVALIFGIFLGSGEEDDPSGRPKLYWNVDRLTYTQNSETGLSTREPGEDGTYKVRFAINGELVEYAVSDKQLINYIDTLDAMGLVLDNDDVVVDVKDPKEIANEVNKNAYVKDVTADSIICNTSIAMNGMNVNVKIEDVTQIYDVTPGAEVPGKIIQPSDLKPMDTLCIYANGLDQVTHVYLFSHSKESKVYWRAAQSWNSSLKETSRVPDENGVYTIPFFCEGELVELKTKDKAIATKVDSVSRYSCHFGFEFDEEGYIVAQFNSALGIGGILACERWDVVSVEGDTYTIQRLLTNDGSIWTGTVPADCVVYDVSNAAKAEGRQGQQVDGLKLGDRVCLWTDTNGTPVLAYVSNRLVDSPAYYIPATKYSSAKKETTREPNWQGYYEIELVKEGSNAKQVYYVKDKETMNFIDSQNTKCVGLKVGAGNIIEYAYDSEAITGYSCATRGGVTTAVTGGIFTKITYGQPGTEVNFVQAAGCRIYNMSTYGTYGEETTLRPGDHIYGYRQPSGEILLIYVVKRQIGGNSMYYNLERKYDSTAKETTREPDADGWYVFTLGHNGKVVTLRTKNKTLASQVDAFDPCAMSLEVSGDVILKAHDPTYGYAGAKTASGYRYQGINAEGLHYATYTNSTTGKTTTNTFKMAEGCKIYNVSSVFEEFKGERVYSIKQNDMLTVYTNWYGEAEIIYIRGRDVEDLYWKTEVLYDSTNKVTKRTPDADGYYWFNLAINGEMKTFKTKDQKVANSMDSYAGAFGLKVKGDEILSFVSTTSVKNVKGNGVIGYNVTAINGKTITLTYNKPGSSFGNKETIKLSSSTKIFDVSPSALAEGKFGAATTLKVGDTVRTYLSRDGETHSYVFIQARSTRKGGEVGYCEVCKKDVTWNPITNSSSISAQNGHWYVTADTESFVQHSFATSGRNYTICLDLNGHTLSRSENGRLFRVASGEILNVFDSVGGGKLVTGGGTSFNGGMMMVTDGATFNMYSGTMEFVQGEIKNGYGGNIYATGTNTEVNIYGGTITGGTTYSQGSTKSGFGGNIYAQSKATVNLYGGVIEKGRAVSDVYDKTSGGQGRGGASGGNIHVESGATLNIYDGAIIRDGVADQHGGNIFQRNTKSGDQYATINMYGGQVLGGQCDAEGKGSYYGGNISAAAHLNLLGGVVSGGKQGSNDYDIYITGDKLGDVVIGSAQVDGKLRVNGPKSLTLTGAPKLAMLNLFNYMAIVGELTEGADIKVLTSSSTLVFTTPFDMANDYLQAGYFKAYNDDQEIRVTAASELTVAKAGEGIDPNTIYTAAKAMNFSTAAADGKVTAKCPVCNKSADWYPLGVVNAETNNSGKTAIDNVSVKIADGQHYHYYLSESVDYTQNTGFYYFGGETKVCLNLNGQTIQSTRRAFYTETTGTELNIMGEGIVRGNGTETANSGIIDAVRVVNLYGGTYESTGAVSAALCARGTNAACVVGIYEGTTLRTTNGTPAISLPNTTVATVAATININGGNVEGKVVLGHAKGTINLSGSPVISDLDLTNGYKVNVGELVDGAEIHVTANGVFTAERSDIGSVRDYFHSNVSGKDIVVEGGALALGEKKAVICAHCGKTEAELEAAGTPWTPWTAAYGSANKGTIQSGHYYLTESNLSMTGYFYIGASTADVAGQGVDVVLDMRGYSLKSSSRVFYTYQNNDLTIMDSVGGSTITGGLKNHGGVIYFGDGTDAAAGESAHLGIYGVEVIDAVTDTRNSHNGGAIYISGSADLTLDDCTVTGLSAKVGPAVYASHGEITIRNSTINGGTAAEKAGAIYVNKGTLTLENTTVNSGTAPYAPGVEVITGTLNVIGGNIEDVWMHEANSTTNISGAAVIGTLDLTNKDAKINVGELTTGASITVVADGVFTNDLTDPAAVKGYFASGVHGKGIVVEGNALAVGEVAVAQVVCPHCGKTSAELEAAGTPWTPWTPYEDKVGSTNKGVIPSGHYYLEDDIAPSTQYYIGTSTDDDTNNLSVDVVIDLYGHKLNSEGRAFYMYTNNHLTMLDSVGGGEITGKLNGSAGVLYVGDGGGMASLNLYGVTIKDVFTGTRTQSAGVITVSGDSVLNAKDTTFVGGTAKIGGCITATSNGTINLDNCTVTGGAVSERGGAIYLGKATLNLVKSTVTGGTATIEAPCVYVSSGTVNVEDSTVDNIFTAADGSDVFATITVSGKTVVGTLDLTSGAKLTDIALTTDSSVTVVADDVFTAELADPDAAKEFLQCGVAGKTILVKGKTLAIGTGSTGSDKSIYQQAKEMDFSAGGTVNAVCPVCGTAQDWLPLPAANGSSNFTRNDGHYHYYLDANTDYTGNTKHYLVGGTATMCINLNGQRMVSTTRALIVDGSTATMNIMGEGFVTGAAMSQINRGTLDTTGEMNLYGGTYECTNSAAPVLAVRGSKAANVTNIYEGTVIQRAENAPGVNVYILDNGELNLYGGIIRGGDTTADDTIFGGNIWIKANATSAYSANLNVYGGIIENGKDAKGGNIYVTGNTGSAPTAAVTISGGQVLGGGIYATGANASINISGNPVVDYLEMDGANLVNVANMTEGADITVKVADGVAFTNAIAANADAYAAYFHAAEGTHKGAIVKDNALQFATVCPHCGVALADITWTDVAASTATVKSITADGHYRLSGNIEVASGHGIQFADATASTALDIVLDMNGHFITTDKRAIHLGKYQNLTIFDSVGGGYTSSSGTGNTGMGGTGVYIHTGASLTMYDITVNAAPVSTAKGTAIFMNGSTTTFNMYSGVLNGNTNETSGVTGGAVYNGGEMNMYGGTINGSNLPNGTGDCIYVASSAKLNIFGGELKGEITGPSDAKIAVSGAPIIDNLVIPAGAKITLGELEEDASITVDAEGAFTQANDKAQAYVDAKNVEAVEGKQITVADGIMSMSVLSLLKAVAQFFGLA